MTILRPEGSFKGQEVRAVISKISSSGLVSIDFNQKLNSIADASTKINDTVLYIYVTDKSGEEKESYTLKFDWTTKNFYENKPRGAI